jgi:hypothetical protein
MFEVTDVLEFLDDGKKWHKGDFSNDERTCFCVYGAVCQLENLQWFDAHDEDGNLIKPDDWNSRNSRKVLTEISDVIKAKFPHRVNVDGDEITLYNVTGWVARFNDHKDTNWEDVKSVLLEAGKAE